LPAGKVVKFIVTADDVIHSFAVPAFWVKQDANPGQLHETWAVTNREGVYFGQCSELCGARHGFMPIGVEVTSPAKFAQWIAQNGGHMPGAKPAAPAAGGTGGGVSTPAPVTAVATTPATSAPNNKNVANRATGNA
jgi:cytochrome c oxidase subunit II